MSEAKPRASVPAADLRVLLWDIDGTLLHAARAGAFKEYFVPAVESVFGTAGQLRDLRVSGMTDLQIVSEALRDEGFTPAHIRERVNDLRTRFMFEMERVVAAAATADAPLFQLLPGVREILTRVAAQPRYLSSLLTGNLEPAAYLKLRTVGLSEFFQLPGAFGEDSHDRRDLPALAAARINQHLALDLSPAQFIIIGDTPNDIACARHFGARSVAVCTGRFESRETLAPLHPDALLADLSDTDAVLRALDAL